MRFFLTLSLLLGAFSASAIELSFNFTVNSSGPDIYACNAGIRRPQQNPRQVCYLRDQNSGALSQTTCNSGDHNCVCTGVNGGSWLQDYVVAEFTEVDSGNSARTVKAEMDRLGSSWSRLFGTPSGAHPRVYPFQKQLNKVTFNLGSETFGTEYFLDVCYRGPQIQYWDDGARTNFSLKARIAATDITNDRFGNYLNLSGLQVSAVAVCDIQGHGQFQYAGELLPGHPNASTDGFVYDNMLANRLNVDNAGDSVNGRSFVFPERPFNTTQVSIFNNQWITRNSGKTPRFCVVRYLLREGNRSGVRGWIHHNTTFSTLTAIEEDVVVE